MISVTELWCGKKGHSHKLRYQKPLSTEKVKPVVVWNSTRRCNLKCLHCYSDSHNQDYPSELTTDEAKGMISDLAEFDVTCLLISGGEPLLRKDIWELLRYAKSCGLPTTISTNGTIIDDNYATMLSDTGVRYVGISLDGLSETNDAFRGVPGAFEKVCRAFTNLNNHNVNCGLRMTLTKHNLNNLHHIFNYVEEYSIGRVCFYHLVPTGRATDAKALIPSPQEIRKALDEIIDWVESLASRGMGTEVLTVDNHADNIYLYLKSQTDKILSLIRRNGGARFSSGVGIACIDAQGDIHPDQFWRDCTLGNIRERRFQEIWWDPKNETLDKLRNRTEYIKGRCSRCKWLEMCGGGLRSRAYAYTGDPWASDPGCYLKDNEIY